MNLQYFSGQNFYFSIKKFFKDLNIPVHYMTAQPALAQDIISNTYKPKNPAHQLIDDVYFLGMVDDRAFNDQPSIIDNDQLKKKDYDGLLIFGVTLDREGGKLPTRGQMAEVTRAFNREFHYTPVVIVFKYSRYICLSNCERIPYKQTWREGEKTGKVSLLKDIDTVNTHTGHLKILQNLAIPTSGKKAVTTFEGLYNYWQEVFSVALLSKRFYQELSNWYFWALKHVEFPDDAEKDREVRNATCVIRLITRLMFVWFLKEKNLVPDALFDKNELDEHLNYKDYHNSTYYKAILQNLFFATLNTKMKKDDPESRKFVHRQYGVQEFYRYERFFKDKKKALKLFETIPFLNGGLFENLDKNIGRNDEKRIDCFSNRPIHEKRLKVPDFLFFGGEVPIDLSKELGSKKRKNETAKGIIHILNSYKFTIAENTPIEEEIALDPELLGKVFENLLASYNPETKTTARKQTGSFYTPREIVNYMVDESLIAYLEGCLIGLYEKESGFIQTTPPFQQSMFGRPKPLQTKITPSGSKVSARVQKEINDKLRHLLSYSSGDHLFSKKEVKTIIDALDNSKILDPACGSGAFPMGILHKMVHILSRVDPQNKHWKQRQIENQTRQIKQDISYAEKIKDDKARQRALEELEERLATINNAFDTNELDFGRKLYLIENCIFGVDIQPIAVQIAKLRFFISLIVDQIVDENRENLGIIPLPNLETKFVAANTLIEVDKKGQMEFNFQNPQINKKEKELTNVRERHFSARTPNTKEKYRLKDEKLRNEIAELLRRDGFASEVTQRLAHWNPYDQNTFADFFDMEWMFGVKDGFDIVIGNPPYISHDKIKKKDEIKNNCETYEAFADIYCYFIERALSLQNKNGLLCFITSNSYLKAEYGNPIRKFIKNKNVLLILINIQKSQIFGSSIVNVAIILSTKSQKFPKQCCSIVNDSFTGDTSFEDFVQLKGFHYPQSAFDSKTWILMEQKFIAIKNKIEESGKTLEQIETKIRLGLATGNNEAFIINESKKNELCKKNSASIDLIKPILRGRDISRYSYSLPGLYILLTKNGINVKRDYPAIYEHLDSFGKLFKKRGAQGHHWTNLRACSFFDDFKKEKIVWIELTDSGRFALCSEEIYLLNTAYFLLPPTTTPAKYLLGILNSVSIRFYLGLIAETSGMGTSRWINNYVKEFPIPHATSKQYSPIIKQVDKIISTKRAKPLSDTTAHEAEIDGRVAHLYNLTEEEYSLILKETNCPDPFRVAALNVYRDIARGKIK